jgi:colicin import membrane protein
MPQFIREHSGPMFYSVLLHGAIVGALVLAAAATATRTSTHIEPLPINATIVSSQVLHAAQAAKAQQARAAAEQAAAAKAAAEAKAAEEAQAAAAAKAAEEAKAAQDAAEARAAEEAAKREEEARATARKQAVEAKAAADAKRAADERARQEREDELHRQMAEEEHVDAVEASPLRDRYVASLRNRIQNAWIKPPSARVGVDCLVQVTQVPGGEVTSAQVTQCNGDAAVRQSIVNAVYRASPLPDPPDPALFQRNFAFRFKPDE